MAQAIMEAVECEITKIWVKPNLICKVSALRDFTVTRVVTEIIESILIDKTD